MPSVSSNLKADILFLGWMLILLSLPVLSANGRFLQRWVIGAMGTSLVAWLIFMALGVAISGILWILHAKKIGIPFVHLFWVLPLFLCAPFFLPRVEERLHFLVFGAFGVLSMLVYRPRLALIFCLAAAVGDELLQYFLPDRVGDWRDVAMNLVASVAAAVFVWVSMIRPRSQAMKDSRS